MSGDKGAERFCGVQPCRHIGQDARETHVVLWSRLGQHGEVNFCPTTKLDARALVHVKEEWSRNNLWRLDGDGL